jgi:hypothetical protein
MENEYRARWLGVVLAAALMFSGDLFGQSPTPTPIPTPTPECTPAGEAKNGCWEVPSDPHGAMLLPEWADTEYSTNEIAVMLRQDVIALRRFVVIIGGMLLAWHMMSFLFDAITGRR